MSKLVFFCPKCFTWDLKILFLHCVGANELGSVSTRSVGVAMRPRFSPPRDTYGSMETELRVQSAAIIGSLSNVDANVNEIGKKSNRFRLAKQQLCTCITLFCSFLCCHCTKDLKMPYFTFCGGRECKKTTFFFFSWTSIQSYRIHIQKKLPTIKQLKSSKFEAAQFHF